MRFEGRVLCHISTVGSTKASSVFPAQHIFSVWLQEVDIEGPNSRSGGVSCIALVS